LWKTADWRRSMQIVDVTHDRTYKLWEVNNGDNDETRDGVLREQDTLPENAEGYVGRAGGVTVTENGKG